MTNATVLLRVDHLALALTLATIAVFVAGWSIWLVGALAVAAGFAKQPYAILAIAPIVMALWMQGERRQALWFATATAAAGMSLLGLLSLLTDGWAITHMVVYNAAVPWVVDVLFAQTYTFLFTHGLLVGIGIGVVAGLSRREWRHPLPWLFVLSLFVALATIGKEGSWIGYFYPVIASGALLTASAVPNYDFAADQPLRKQAVSAVVIVMIVSQLWMYTVWQPQPQKPLDGQAELAEWMVDVNAPVIAEDPSVAPGQGPPVDVLMVQSLVESGIVDGDPVADALACGRWKYVITWIPAELDNHPHSRWSAGQIAAIERHYELVDKSRRWWVYEFNGTAKCRPA